ncbi:MAG: recombination regulator RecX [candidate division Zixibacteria bacterium]|nr:recombination regulator RecX [candidate division Zixibacteria bacterium]MBU1469077.1 recombination regulator RecX [candidate division Zixibacteria bacterium]MBU2624653.1 recombination regulator RecX [candidate division Zixibacteria bacterium]
MSESSHVVTSIKPSKRVQGRYSVYVDGKFLVSLTADLIANFGLQQGRKLSSSEYESLAAALDERKLRDTAYRLLSRRPHSVKELADKLRQRGFSRSDIEALVKEFCGKDLLGDRKFAESWVETRLRLKPRSGRLLVIELRSKGVDKETAEAVVREKLDGTDEAELAFKLLLGRRQRLMQENWVDTQRKIHNFLRYRGFNSDVILRVAERFEREERGDTTE